jgi:integrase
MKSSNKTSSSYALVPSERLPEVAHTRAGTVFNPNDASWRWTEDVFSVNLNFSSLNLPEQLQRSLKWVLVAFAKVSSSNHLRNLFGVFKHFVGARKAPGQLEVISVQEVSNYSASLKQHEKWRVGTLNVLLQKWAALDLPGLEPGCADFLEERRKPGNVKGAAVRTRDPVAGPFSESEYTALYKAIDAAFGMGQLPTWVVVLTRLLFACGGRISQYASLKVLDFIASEGRYELWLPQVKQREKHSREVLRNFVLSPQTGRLIQTYIDDLKSRGGTESEALFPAHIVMPIGHKTEPRPQGDLFAGHCTQKTLSRLYVRLVGDVAPPTERLHFANIPVSPKRFRYTFGTRMVEEGASKAVLADRLGHTDLQNVDHYFEASPKIVESIDRAMDQSLAPLAAAFRGRLIEGEAHATHKGAPGSRIIDFRVAPKPLASCAGKGAGCSFNKPVACYTCFKFEPWLDAPHEKVLERLELERARHAGDERIAKVNDDAILAVRQVIAECEQVREQRRGGAAP